MGTLVFKMEEEVALGLVAVVVVAGRIEEHPGIVAVAVVVAGCIEEQELPGVAVFVLR